MLARLREKRKLKLVIKTAAQLRAVAFFALFSYIRYFQFQKANLGHVGIDLNTDNFLTDSEGNIVPNPRYYRTIKNKLAKAQRKLSRRQRRAKQEHRPLRDSKNYQKQRLLVAKLHAQVMNQRHNFLHQLSTALIKNHDLVVAEELRSRNLLKNHALSQAISDVGWRITLVWSSTVAWTGHAVTYARDGWNTGNSRNGAYFRKVDTQFGPIEVQVPRDRNGQFHQHTLPDYKQHSDVLESTIIKLYSKGVTTREIADLIEKMYGSHYSPAQVSNISKQMLPKVEAYHKRKLSDKFFCVYLDATYLPLRRKTFEREAVFNLSYNI